MDGEEYYEGKQYYEQHYQAENYQTEYHGEILIQGTNQGYGSIDQTPAGEIENNQGYVCMVREISPTHFKQVWATQSLDYKHSTLQCE